MDAANAVLTALVDDGTLRAAESARMTNPTWNRTQPEFLIRSGLTARIAADPRAVETHWHVVLLRLTRRPR